MGEGGVSRHEVRGRGNGPGVKTSLTGTDVSILLYFPYLRTGKIEFVNFLALRR
jgi:hypothetical protein